MERIQELEQEVIRLRQVLSQLSEASLRINESLDFETVLQGVLDSARVLIGSRYGILTLMDENGRALDCVASGLTPEQSARFWKMPHVMRFFASFSRSSKTMRLRDFQGRAREMDLPEFKPPVPVREAMTFLAAPLCHRGESVGKIYLAEKEGGPEFTQEDEETLVMFASQAALVIANARRHQEEKKAKADLEALIETSPVGVVVFEVKTGRVLTYNREIVRIAESLQTEVSRPEQILEVLTVRRADGRELTFGERSIAHAFRDGEAVRAEEIVLRGPDGRSVTALLNATPIMSEDGAAESFIVTVQDLTHLEEVEQLRADFLAIVSHDLRGPLAAIKGSATTVLGDTVGVERSEMVQLFHVINQQADQMRGLINDLLDVACIRTGTLQVNPGPVTATALVEEARSTFLRGSGRDNVHFDLAPDLAPVMADQRRIVQVLDNLLSNAARNSPDTSPIVVAAAQDGVHVAFSVTDKGRGVAPDRLPKLFQKFPPAGTNGRGDDETGAGMGLAICKGIVEAHGGRIWAESKGVDMGTRVTFTIPVSEDAEHGDVSRSSARYTRKKQDGRMRVLVVDDDPQTLRKVREALSGSGFVPVVTADPAEVPALIEAHEPQLVLMDLVLPDTDGIEVMKGVLEITDVPIIFLSAYGHEEAIARAFDAGADDYVVKPFSRTELTARIRAALRKRTLPRRVLPSEPFVLDALAINYRARTVTLAGQPVSTTDIEFRFLEELSLNSGQILTYEQLLQRVWRTWNSADTRTMRSVVKNLRRKLGDDAGKPRYIVNKPRVGYCLGKIE